MRMILGLDRPDVRHGQRQRPPVRRRPRRRCARSARSSTRTPSTPGGPRATTCAGWPRPTASRPRRVDEVLELVGLDSVAGQRAGPVLARHGPAARHRRRAARRPAGRRPRRAGQRPRPRGHPLGAHLRPAARRRGPHGLHLQPPDVGDGADGRPPDRDRPRPDPGRLLDDRLHGRPRRVVRPGRRRRRSPTSSRLLVGRGLDVDSASTASSGSPGLDAPADRRAARQAPACCCTS